MHINIEPSLLVFYRALQGAMRSLGALQGAQSGAGFCPSTGSTMHKMSIHVLIIVEQRVQVCIFNDKGRFTNAIPTRPPQRLQCRNNHINFYGASSSPSSFLPSSLLFLCGLLSALCLRSLQDAYNSFINLQHYSRKRLPCGKHVFMYTLVH